MAQEPAAAQLRRAQELVRRPLTRPAMLGVDRLDLEEIISEFTVLASILALKSSLTYHQGRSNYSRLQTTQENHTKAGAFLQTKFFYKRAQWGWGDVVRPIDCLCSIVR